jgi:hypothetical protein
MADINIERKSRPTWLWAVVLLVALLLAWLAWSTLTRSPRQAEVVMTPVDVRDGEMVMQQTPGAPADEVAGATGGAVGRFVRTCGEPPANTAPVEGGASFELACVREITNALASLVLADTIGAGRLDDQLRELRRLVQDAERERIDIATRPEDFGEIARRATDLMTALQGTRAPGSRLPEEELGRARTAAAAVGAGTPADEARRQMSTFFQSSARVMRALEAREG